MEIITGVERRRRWRIEDKLRIVAEAETPGAIISHVARRHHISRGLLSNWRQQVRRGALAADDHSAVFMPVRMLSEPMSSSPAVAVPREQNGVAGVVAEDRRIEIALTAPASEWARTSGWWRYAGSSRPCAGDRGPFCGPRLARGGAHRHAARYERLGAPGAASAPARSARGGPLRVPGQAR